MAPLLHRTHFWRIVIQALQIGLSSVQGITLAEDLLVNNFNIWIAVIQGLLAIVSILTQDANANNKIDLVEDNVTTTTTVKVTAPKSADIQVDTETTNDDDNTKH